MASTLHSTARTGNVTGMLTLLNRGADVNLRDEAHGQTALMWASGLGHSEVVRILLEKGADPNMTNDVGYTALMAAVRNSRHRCAALLIDAGATIDAKDKWGCTPLMFAAKDGLPETVKLLLDHGADVNSASTNGSTPLMAVALRSSEPEQLAWEICDILLLAGADKNAATLVDFTG